MLDQLRVEPYFIALPAEQFNFRGAFVPLANGSSKVCSSLYTPVAGVAGQFPYITKLSKLGREQMMLGGIR